MGASGCNSGGFGRIGGLPKPNPNCIWRCPSPPKPDHQPEHYCPSPDQALYFELELARIARIVRNSQNKISPTQTNSRSLSKADLPGLKKDKVKVEIEDDRVLQISRERKVEKKEKNDTWHRVERSSEKFVRRFRLPENAKMDGVKASMDIYLRRSSKFNSPEQKMK
ncbi:hypothetical protein ACSBR2_002751 [Camellia fascicularis]